MLKKKGVCLQTGAFPFAVTELYEGETKILLPKTRGPFTQECTQAFSARNKKHLVWNGNDTFMFKRRVAGRESTFFHFLKHNSTVLVLPFHYEKKNVRL